MNMKMDVWQFIPDALYHAHIDAEWVTPEFEAYLKGMSFIPENFISGEWVPNVHLSHEFSSTQKEEFYSVIESLKVYTQENPCCMQGYIETEVVRQHLFITHNFIDLPAPFSVQMRRLDPGTFRHSEVHVVCVEEESNPQVAEKLEECGLYPARYREQKGTGLVYTVQGMRTEISAIYDALCDYLDAVGGLNEGAKIWRETIVWWWASQLNVKLPPVVRELIWR